MGTLNDAQSFGLDTLNKCETAESKTPATSKSCDSSKLSEISNDLENRLRNWAAWARDRQSFSHCASLEHRYKSPQHWYPEEPKTPVDILDAIALQKVIAGLGHDYAWALTFAYCYPGYDRWKAAAKCRVYRPERLIKLQRRAEFMVRNLSR